MTRSWHFPGTSCCWMNWSSTGSDTGSQHRLGTLELGPGHPAGTLPWCQNREGGEQVLILHTEGLEDEMWTVVFGMEGQWCSGLSSVVQRRHFVQPPVNKTVWAGWCLSAGGAGFCLSSGSTSDWNVSTEPSIKSLQIYNLSDLFLDLNHNFYSLTLLFKVLVRLL